MSVQKNKYVNLDTLSIASKQNFDTISFYKPK